MVYNSSGETINAHNYGKYAGKTSGDTTTTPTTGTTTGTTDWYGALMSGDLDKVPKPGATITEGNKSNGGKTSDDGDTTSEGDLPSVDAHAGPYTYGVGYYTDDGVVPDETSRQSRDPTLDIIDAHTGEAKTSPEVQEVMDNTGYTKEQAIEFIKTGNQVAPVVGTAPVPDDVVEDAITTPPTQDVAEEPQNKGVFESLWGFAENVSDRFNEKLNTINEKSQDLIGFDLFPVASASEQQPVLDPNLKEAADQIGTFELTPYPYDDKPGTLDKLSAWWDLATAEKEKREEATTNLFLQYGLSDPFSVNTEVGRPAAQVVDLVPEKYEAKFAPVPVLNNLTGFDNFLTGVSVGLTGLRDVLYREDKKAVSEYAAFAQSGRDVGDLGFFEAFRINRGAAIVNSGLNDDKFLGIVFDDAPTGATINFMGTNLTQKDIEKSRQVQYGDNADLIKDSASDVKYYGWLSDNVLHPFTDAWEIGTGSAFTGLSTLYGKVRGQQRNDPPSIEKYFIGAGKTVRNTIVDLPAGIVAVTDVAARHGDYFYDNMLSGRYNNQAGIVPNLGLISGSYTNVVNPLVAQAQERKIDEELIGGLAAEVALAITGDLALDAVKYGSKVGKLKATTALKNAEINIRNKHFPLRTDDDLLRDARRRMGKDVKLEDAKAFYIDVDKEYPKWRTVEKTVGMDDTGQPITMITTEKVLPGKHLHPDAKYEIPKIESNFVDPELVFQGSALEPSLFDKLKNVVKKEPSPWKQTPYGVTDQGGRVVSETWDDLTPFARENTRPGKPVSAGEELVKRKNEYRDKMSPSKVERVNRDFEVEIPYSKLAAQGQTPVSYLTHASSDLLKPKNSAYTVIDKGSSEVGKSLYGAKDMMAAPAFTRVAQRRSLISLKKGRRPENPSVTRIEVDADQIVKPDLKFDFGGETRTVEDALKETKKVRGQYRKFMEMRDAVVKQTGKSVFDTPKYFNMPRGVVIEHEKTIAAGSRLVENPFIRNYTKLGSQMVHLRAQKHIRPETSALARPLNPLNDIRSAVGELPQAPGIRLNNPLSLTDGAPRNLGNRLSKPLSLTDGAPRNLGNRLNNPLSPTDGAPRNLGNRLNRPLPPAVRTQRTRRNLPDADIEAKQKKIIQNIDYDGYINVDTLGKTIGASWISSLAHSGTGGVSPRVVLSSHSTTTQPGMFVISPVVVNRGVIPPISGGVSPISPVPGGVSPISPIPGGSSPITPISGGDVIINPLFPASSRSLVAARRPRATPYPPYPGDDDDGPGKKKKKKKGVQPKQKKAKRTNTLINPDAFFGFHLK